MFLCLAALPSESEFPESLSTPRWQPDCSMPRNSLDRNMQFVAIYGAQLQVVQIRSIKAQQVVDNHSNKHNFMEIILCPVHLVRLWCLFVASGDDNACLDPFCGPTALYMVLHCKSPSLHSLDFLIFKIPT